MRILTAFGIVLMVLSAPLLYFGLMGPTIEYVFSVKIFGNQYPVLANQRTLMGKHGLVQWLFKNEAYMGACLLILFGLILPICKYLVFFYWISGVGCRATANWALSIMQRIGKWTAVDAVCSAVVVGMLLKLPSADAAHGPAYVSFILYCFLSTLAFFCLPGELEVDDPNPTPLNLAIAAKLTSPRVRAIVLVASLASFLMLLTIAGGSHTVHMWVPKEVMNNAIDKLIKELEHAADDRIKKQIGGNIPIPRLTPQLRDQIKNAAASLPQIDSRVSVSGCITRLLESHHKYSVWGSVVLFFCIVFLPVVYAVLTAAKALSMTEWSEYQSSSRDPLMAIPEDQSVKGELSPWHGIDKFRSFARDFSMLDVLAVGLFVGHIVTKDENGLKTGLEPQFFFVVLAAASWHFHNFLCSCIQASTHCEYGKEPETEDLSSGTGSTGGVY